MTYITGDIPPSFINVSPPGSNTRVYLSPRLTLQLEYNREHFGDLSAQIVRDLDIDLDRMWSLMILIFSNISARPSEQSVTESEYYAIEHALTLLEIIMPHIKGATISLQSDLEIVKRQWGRLRTSIKLQLLPGDSA